MQQPQRAPGTAIVPADMALANRARAGDGAAFRAIMQANNRRLYRVARSILKHDAEAEDTLQEAYLRAFTRLETFRGESSLATWLTRIVINEALGRRRSGRATIPVDTLPEAPVAEIIPFPQASSGTDPERSMAQRQILKLVEQATDDLPDVYRMVFVTRVIEGMSVEETAALLGIREETVKTRLHRARHLVRKQLDRQIGPLLLDAFPFAGRRCERLTDAVMRRLGQS